MPVFPYGGLYLGPLMMFGRASGTVDCQLAASADTLRWQRISPGRPLVPRGPAGSYDCGCIYGALAPIAAANQLLLCYGGSNGPHTGWRDGFFCLARLRPDGFAGLLALGSSPGEVLTQPIP